MTREHLTLLNEMYLMAQNVIEVKRQKLDDFIIGYHAEPSMQQVHLHVVSTDFNSPCLTNKKHWNSFHTDFLIPHQGEKILQLLNQKMRLRMIFDVYKNFENSVSEIIRRIEVDGKISKLDASVAKELLATPLKCNQCPATPKNMPYLKSHLLKHLSGN